MDAIMPSTVADLPEQDIKISGNAGKWHTGDEIHFIHEMRVKNPEVCQKYCALVISGMRYWDPCIDVGRVIRFAHSILADPKGVAICQ